MGEITDLLGEGPIFLKPRHSGKRAALRLLPDAYGSDGFD